MIEPLFGSGSAIWPGVPSSGFGWSPAPLSIGNRTAAAGAAGFGSLPFITQVPATQGFASGVPAGNVQGLTGVNGVLLDAFGSSAFGVPGVIPSLAGPDVANGPTARGLLAAVAVRRGQPMGPTNDQEVEEFIYDAFDMLLGANEVEARYDGGRITLTGSVAHKRIKRDVGEIAWAIPGASDVQNNVSISGRRRARPSREVEASSGSSGRKPT